LDVNMARAKLLPDSEVLEAAHRLIHERGPEGLTFASLSQACGLSAATLVQRFRSKPELVRSTLLQGWDRLDERTRELASTVPRTPAGAVQLLAGLSGYGDMDAYANGLLVLREDLRDPVLRARGRTWKDGLVAALDICLEEAGPDRQGLGLLMASHWQGCLLWWSFEPVEAIEAHVRRSLEHFLAALLKDPG
jgi:AcrR family transcriptional regulator